jgi:hypothetical protein
MDVPGRDPSATGSVPARSVTGVIGASPAAPAAASPGPARPKANGLKPLGTMKGNLIPPALRAWFGKR